MQLPQLVAAARVALALARRITLAPVRQVSQIPPGETGSTALGVQIEPSGLSFVQPATLLIGPSAAAAIPIHKLRFVPWDGQRIAGQTALQSMVYAVRDKLLCRSVVQPQRVGSTFAVASVDFVTAGEDIADYRIAFLARRTGSHFKVRDDGAVPPVVAPLEVQLNHGISYGPLRVLTAANPVEAWLVREFHVNRGTVLATKAERVTYQASGATLYYDDRWELRHAPGL